MKHKICSLIPNTLAQALVALEGCYMVFLEYFCNIKVVVENIFYSSNF